MEHRRNKPNHHGAQLCKQIRQAIELALICDCGDDSLADLEVLEVVALGRGSRVLVICASRSDDPRALPLINEKLVAAGPVLRDAVAREIHRKRVPSLKFEVVYAPV